MKSKGKRIFKILIIGFMISLVHVNIINFNSHILKYDKNRDDVCQYNVKSSGHYVLEDTTILIYTSDPIYNWTWASNQDWCIGSGTMGDPYIIENLTMIGYDHQASIWIIEPNVYFIIRNCTFIDTPSALDIMDANNAKFINNTFSNAGTGIRFSSCEHNTIFGNKFYGGYAGIYFNGDFGHNVTGNEFYNTNSGLRIVNDAYDCLIYSNTFNDNIDAIYLWAGENNNFSSNIMNGCGFYFDYEPGRAETNIIETTNLVNGKPLYCYKNKLNLNSNNFTNAGQVILIKCNNSQISYLNLSYTNRGITLISCKNNTLINLNCSFNNYAGIYLRDCFNISLNNNIATYNNYDGIRISNGNGFNLTNNHMIDCGLNIYGELKDYYFNDIDTTNEVHNRPLYYIINQTGLDPSSYPNAGQLILIDCNSSIIKNLELYNTSQGLVAYHCYNNQYSNISSFFNYIGIYLVSCSNNIISGNNATQNGAYGIYFYSDCNNNTIIGNELSNNTYSGLYISGYNNKLIDNIITNNQYYGLGLGGQYNNATYNYISNNDKSGIYLSGSYNKISKNNITNNYDYGIKLGGSDNTISENNISNNENHGIYTENAIDNTITGNLIKDNNRTGIYMYRWCDNNDVISNDIKYNDELGIFLHDDTNFNTIYNNNFTGNLVNAEDHGTINVWDNGVVGNYWDDYSGVDDDDDGIGDTPYTDIGGSAGTQDDYPIWWDPPAFSIISPIENQMLGGEAPEFIIEIEAGDPDFMWYTLSTSSTKYFFDSNTTINQGAWDTISSDTITITFFINDSAGITVFDEVIVRLDKVIPIVIINLPYQNEKFGEAPPSFNIIALDDFLDETWYTLNDGLTNHSCGLSGQIDQTLWDTLPGGTYNLRFYASDTGGNIGFSEVIIIKTTPSIIPSFDVLLIFLTVLISIISISWQIRKKH